MGVPRDQWGEWTYERVELLKKLWGTGLSGTQMAEQIGGGFSRNAVIGKAHRLGLAARGQAKAKRARHGPRPAAPRRRSTFWDSVEGVAKLPLPADEAIDPSTLKTLQDLDDKDCRWPIGDPLSPTFGFCGCAKVPGLPYCEGHARRAYIQPPPRQQILPSAGDSFNRRGERVKIKESVR